MPVIQHLVRAYKLWHEFLPHIPRDTRYTLGTKIDFLLIETIEAVFSASFLTGERKLIEVQKAAAKLDLAKFFIQIVWDVRGLDQRKYIALSELLKEIGRMLGGWSKQVAGRN